MNAKRKAPMLVNHPMNPSAFDPALRDEALIRCIDLKLIKAIMVFGII